MDRIKEYQYDYSLRTAGIRRAKSCLSEIYAHQRSVVRFAGLASRPVWATSVFFSKARQGSALGINSGTGNNWRQCDAVACAAGYFLPIFTFRRRGVPQPDGSLLALTNATLDLRAVTGCRDAAARFVAGNDIKTGFRRAMPHAVVLKRLHCGCQPAVHGDIRVIHRLFRGFRHARQNAISRRKHSATGVLWPLSARWRIGETA